MMKKLMMMAALALMGTAAQAQVHEVESTSKFTRPAETLWYVRAGAGIDGEVGGDFSGAFGYNLGFGFNRTIGHKGAYWGMELGLASRNNKLEDDVSYYLDRPGASYENYRTTTVTTKRNVLDVYFQPLWFGWKIPVSNSITIDPHVSGFLSFSFAGDIGEIDNCLTNIVDEDGNTHDVWTIGKDKYEEEPGAGAQIGCGVWFSKKFNIDLSWRQSFTQGVRDMGAKAMLSVGYAF